MSKTKAVTVEDFTHFEPSVLLASGPATYDLKRLSMTVNPVEKTVVYHVEYAYKFQLDDTFDTLEEAIKFYNHL